MIFLTSESEFEHDLRKWFVRRITSKYRKNEYMRRYKTINGANIAFKMPMKTKRRWRLENETVINKIQVISMQKILTLPLELSCSSL